MNDDVNVFGVLILLVGVIVSIGYAIYVNGVRVGIEQMETTAIEMNCASYNSATAISINKSIQFWK